MAKLARITALCAIFSLGLAFAPAQAVSAGGGTLHRTRRSISWTGGPFILSEPNYAGSVCIAGRNDPICDHYALTVNLGEGALIEVRITTKKPEPSEGRTGDGDDYDVFVYGPDGRLVGYSETPGGNEMVRFRHRAQYRGKAYEIRVGPWFVVPGSTYQGRVTALTLGR